MNKFESRQPLGTRHHSVVPLLHFYARPHKPLHGALASTERFRAAAQDAKVGPDKDIPHITAPTIIKHTSSLQLLELL